jgi:hypothetical protein
VNARTSIILGVGVTVRDLERALMHTGLTLSSTLTPHVYTIDHAKQRLPLTAFDFSLPAMVRRQAD